MSSTNALGMIETRGLVGAVEAADALVKSRLGPVLSLLWYVVMLAL